VSKRDEGIRGRADFLDRLRRNPVFGRLVRFFDSERLSRFEELCWRARCASLRNELTGAPAKRALSHLLRLRQSLGNCAWLKQSVVTSLEQLQDELDKLARRVKRGRREDHTAQVFRDAAEVFVCGGLDLRERRLPSRDSVDKALAGVFAVVFGRTISVESFVRMRQRERARLMQASVETRTPSGRKVPTASKSTRKQTQTPHQVT
jgi:hypothetical protein